MRRFCQSVPLSWKNSEGPQASRLSLGVARDRADPPRLVLGTLSRPQAAQRALHASLPSQARRELAGSKRESVTRGSATVKKIGRSNERGSTTLIEQDYARRCLFTPARQRQSSLTPSYPYPHLPQDDSWSFNSTAIDGKNCEECSYNLVGKLKRKSRSTSPPAYASSSSKREMAVLMGRCRRSSAPTRSQR